MAKAWGTEWVTGMNSTSHGPIRRLSPSRTAMNWCPVGQARLLDPVAGQAQRSARSRRSGREIAQQVGQAAGVVLVAVGEHDPVDPVWRSRAGR